MRTALLLLAASVAFTSALAPVVADPGYETLADREMNIGQGQCTTTGAPISTTQGFGLPENFSVVYHPHGHLKLKAAASIVGTAGTSCLLTIELVGVRYSSRPVIPGFPPNGQVSNVVAIPCTAVPGTSTSTCTATLDLDWEIDFATVQDPVSGRWGHVTTDVLFDVCLTTTAIALTGQTSSSDCATAWLYEPSVPKVL